MIRMRMMRMRGYEDDGGDEDVHESKDEVRKTRQGDPVCMVLKTMIRAKVTIEMNMCLEMRIKIRGL